MKNKILSVALSALGASALSAQANNTSTDLAQWNMITSGDVKNVTDFFGNAYVGGNFTVGNSVSTSINDHDTATPGNVSLAVGGNISSGGPINVNSGNVVVGGSLQGGRTLNMNSHGTITQGNPAALPPSPVAQITSASQYWSGLAANSIASVVPNQITFNCANNSSVAIFNVTASQLFAPNQSLSLNPSGVTSQVLINVSGTSVTELNSENIIGSFQNLANSVVFNFYQATTVDLNGSSMYGYLVAPNATVTAISPIVGGVMASSVNVGSEVERGNGPANYIDAPNLVGVPDGGTTAALLGLSFSGVAIIRRKYSRR